MTDTDDAPEWSEDHFRYAQKSVGGKVVREAVGTFSNPGHKDLSEATRSHIVYTAENWAKALRFDGESLALAREAWIEAFDRMAEELDA